MRSIHKPSPDLFVVHGLRDVPDSIASRMKSLGSVERVAADVPSWILQIEREGPDPRVGWAWLRQQLDDMLAPGLVSAEPVLLDELGERHLPTGEVTVRFRAPPSDADLDAFAEAHDLKLRSRTAYVPQQVVFLPRNPSRTYLPELVSDLVDEDGVTSAWANTRSRYRRTSR